MSKNNPILGTEILMPTWYLVYSFWRKKLLWACQRFVVQFSSSTAGKVRYNNLVVSFVPRTFPIELQKALIIIVNIFVLKWPSILPVTSNKFLVKSCQHWPDDLILVQQFTAMNIINLCYEDLRFNCAHWLRKK